MRIVFQFVRHGAQEAILLEAVGTHDEVYESSQPHLEFPVRECTRGWRQGPREQSGRRKDARQRGAISRERRERTAEGKQGTRSPPDPKPQSQTPSDLPTSLSLFRLGGLRPDAYPADTATHC